MVGKVTPRFFQVYLCQIGAQSTWVHYLKLTNIGTYLFSLGISSSSKSPHPFESSSLSHFITNLFIFTFVYFILGIKYQPNLNVLLERGHHAMGLLWRVYWGRGRKGGKKRAQRSTWLFRGAVAEREEV